MVSVPDFTSCQLDCVADDGQVTVAVGWVFPGPPVFVEVALDPPHAESSSSMAVATATKLPETTCARRGRGAACKDEFGTNLLLTASTCPEIPRGSLRLALSCVCLESTIAT